MGGIASRLAVGQGQPQEVPRSAAMNAARAVAKRLEGNPVVPEMDPELLKAISKVQAIQTEQQNPYASQAAPAESELRRTQFQQLQTDAEHPPPGRASELALQRCLGWRATDDEPPVARVARDLKLDDSIVRSILLNLGTPQASFDRANVKVGTWVALRDAVNTAPNQEPTNNEAPPSLAPPDPPSAAEPQR